MRDDSLTFLRELVEIGAPSGYEQPVQAAFRRYVEPYCDGVEIDVMGNAIARRNPDGAPRVMLAGHADEIGFQVRYVNDDGFVYFGAVGGWDSEIAVGQRVTIHTRTGPLRGVIGKKPIHLLDPDERKKKSELHTLWIDTGLRGKEAVLERVAIGDPVTIHAPFDRLGDDLAVAKSFDNRMAVFVCAETLRLLHGESLRAAVFSVSTVQEEIGLRGARASAFGIDPTVGIALDVTHATDYPDCDKRRVGDIRVGGGPVIARGANINPRVFERLVQAATEEGIPYQIEAEPGGTGTDANVMQTSRAGMATGLVSVPLRYMHTPCEVLSLADLENACRLCAAFIRRLTPEQSWLP